MVNNPTTTRPPSKSIKSTFSWLAVVYFNLIDLHHNHAPPPYSNRPTLESLVVAVLFVYLHPLVVESRPHRYYRQLSIKINRMFRFRFPSFHLTADMFTWVKLAFLTRRTWISREIHGTYWLSSVFQCYSWVFRDYLPGWPGVTSGKRPFPGNVHVNLRIIKHKMAVLYLGQIIPDY